jgi:hypothetical protein
MLHDLTEGYPGSRRRGAEWAKPNLDPSWSELIDSSWGFRPDPAAKVREAADPAAFLEALRFLRCILDETEACHHGAATLAPDHTP